MELTGPLTQYAMRFHAGIGAEHHVASPLGAWLVLALCAAADTDAPKDGLAEALGMEPDAAVRTAAALLETPHPLIAAAAAIWQRLTDAKVDFSGLPPTVETGPLPDQKALDAWAREHTFGLIETFPLQLDPETVLILASALATRVSWDEPFDLVPAERLGAGPWAERLTQVLHTPRRGGHDQHIVHTQRSGDVAVHTARARDGLLVTSVIADPGAPAEQVIATAYEIAAIGAAERRSLFDLPLGPGPLWTIVEEPAQTSSPDGREEWCTAVLPAWSARSEHDLGAPSLGFPAAALVLAQALRLKEFAFVAKQAAVAKYTRVGFEAAAVTAMMMMAAGVPMLREGRRRTAELRFGHPYAVVATANQPGSPWHRVPVFSAWITDPDDA
jgi:hypothetical protein